MRSILPISREIRHPQTLKFQSETPLQRIKRLVNRWVTASSLSETADVTSASGSACSEEGNSKWNEASRVAETAKEDAQEVEWVTNKVVVDQSQSTGSQKSVTGPATSLTDPTRTKGDQSELTESAGIVMTAWAQIVNFFAPEFVDSEQEDQFQKERWFNTKAITWFACIFIVVNWVLYLIFNHSVSQFEKIVYYGIATLATLPLPFLVALDFPRKHDKTYQLLLMFATWVWPISEVVQTKVCFFFEPQRRTCNGKDFLFMMVYSIALPALVLFGCNQKRLYATVGAVIQFILLSILVLPVQRIFVRNVVSYLCFSVFFILLHYFQEAVDRRMFILRLQLKVSYRAQQKAQIAQKQASDSKKRHVSYIFHEVRVPLNSAMLAFQNMQSNHAFQALEHDQAVEIQALSDSMLAMKQVLDDALDLQRMDSGRFESITQPFPFHRSIESMLGPSVVSCANKKLDLKIELDERIEALCGGEDGEKEGTWVVGDPLRLRQVLTNLTSNAVKFSPEGGGTVSVKTILISAPEQNQPPESSIDGMTTLGKGTMSTNANTLASDLGSRPLTNPLPSLFSNGLTSELPMDLQVIEAEEMRKKSAIVIRVEVSDCGPGIRPSESTRLFSPFFQTRLGASQPGRGSGLGLAIVRQIITLSGGRLGVHSRKNAGSTFWFEFDYLIATPEQIAAQRHSTSENMDTLVAISTTAAHVTRLTFAGDNDTSQNAAPIQAPSTSAMAQELLPPTPPDESPAGKNTFFSPPGITARKKSPLGKDRDTAESIPMPPSILKTTVPPPSADSMASMSSSATLSATEGPLQVLVVDDEPITRTLLERMLKRLGCEVTTAEDGAQALGVLLGTMPASGEDPLSTQGPRYFDLVSLDNAMPVMTGEEAVRQFRALGRDDFVVGATGNALREDQESYLQAGADHVLAKPVMLKDLKAMLQIARQRRETRRTTTYIDHIPTLQPEP